MKIGDKVGVTVCYCDPKRDKDQAHRYFLAEYQSAGGALRECFKF